MKNFIFRITNYYFLIFLLILLNEFSLSFLDKTPPLSEESIINIRRLDFIIIISFFYTKYIFLNKKNNSIHNKLINSLKKISFLFFIIISIDIILKFIGIGLNKHWFNETNIRYKSPYDMFSNRPNHNDHNKFGFRGPVLKKEISENILTIAFLGGSTGYTGTPPIPNLLSDNLKKQGVENIVYNFSSNSSNHNQHIHRLIKFLNYKYDAVIFYGGNNETIQYLQYEYRKSYPYNYFMVNEISEFKAFFLKHSSIIGTLENRTGFITGINKKAKFINENFDSWSDDIVINYIETIDKAKLIFQNSLKTNKCNKLIFIPILQPVNPITYNEKKLWNKLKTKISTRKDFINYSDMYTDITFFDNVHVNQASRVKIANKMSNDISLILKNNCNN